MKKLSCKSCGSALQVDGFDRRLAVVHCSHCGVMYDLTKSRAEANTLQNPVAQTSPDTTRTNKQNPESGAESEILLSSGRPGFVHIIFVLVALGVLYRASANLFNSTTITADENQLTVRHSPIPWLPAPTISSSSVEQLFVSEGHTESKNGRRTPYYVLNAVLRDNSLKQLSSSLPDIEQALYLEQEFESVLHIRDRRVAGEVLGTSRHI